MKALVYTGTQQSEIQLLDAPVAGDSESLVDISLCGICGSNMHA
jgi:D-arabinose 1-dehydrogenase-like Zn-dependent alcohol dehydrogenase